MKNNLWCRKVYNTFLTTLACQNTKPGQAENRKKLSPKAIFLLSGFTLLEVLISALIFSFLIIGITGILNVGNWAFPIDSGLLDLQQQSRQAMGWMTREVREARNIQISVINADSDQITFDTADKSGVNYYRDINDTNNDGVVNQVIREYPSGTRRILANYIARLKFSLASPVLRIELRADETVRQRSLSFPLIEQVNLRNAD